MGKVTDIANEYRQGDITLDEMAEKLADNWAPTQYRPYPEETDTDLDAVNQSTIFLLTTDEYAAFDAEMARRRGDGAGTFAQTEGGTLVVEEFGTSKPLFDEQAANRFDGDIEIVLQNPNPPNPILVDGD